MKRIISISLCVLLIFSFCGCGQTKEPKIENDTKVVILPDETTKQTLNGYKTEKTNNENDLSNNNSDNLENHVITTQFYANKSTKKFHTSSCGYAKNIKESNLYKSNNRESLISDGYNPCLKCNP